MLCNSKSIFLESFRPSRKMDRFPARAGHESRLLLPDMVPPPVQAARYRRAIFRAPEAPVLQFPETLLCRFGKPTMGNSRRPGWRAPVPFLLISVNVPYHYSHVSVIDIACAFHYPDAS